LVAVVCPSGELLADSNPNEAQASGDESTTDATSADDGPVEFDVRIGGSWNVLSQPADRRGDPTLMSGAAFRGVGVIGGFALRYVWPVQPRQSDAESSKNASRPHWVAELDVLYGRHRARAFERSEDGDASRRATLHVGLLHIPVLVGYRTPWFLSPHELQIAAGPVILQSLYSDMDIEVDGGTGQTTGLGTAETTHVGATLQIASAVPAGQIRIPLELRGVWNPGVGNTTLERLQDYMGPREPGALEANFDWQLMMLTGASF
jgi:hypothetical protein